MIKTKEAGSKAAENELKDYVIQNIDRAIGENWIKVYYQPMARTLTEEICGMEALARWVDPVHGLLTPDVFIGPLEESLQIHKLDTCIINRICEDYSDSLNEDERIVTVSFNLSRLDFQLCDIHSVIEDALRKNRVPRDALRVEITESMMENNEERMHDVIDRFWDRGLRVWMDDFGSGYSSLNVLKDYHFETLKIDMVFLRNFNNRSREIVKSVVDMAKRIGVHTLAEGVETEEQFKFLKNIGCEKAQGYYIGKPMPYKECRRHLKENGFEMESPVKRKYYHDIGRINILSATPLLSAEENIPNPTGREHQIPLAFVELSNSRLHFLFATESYRSTLKDLGLDSTVDVEKDFGNGDTVIGQKFLSLMQKAKESGEVASVDFVRGNNYCFAQVRAIAEYPGGDAFLCILQNLSEDKILAKKNLLSENLQSLCEVYERIEIVDLNTGYSENLYMTTETKSTYNRIPAAEELKIYSEEEIFREDKKAFLEFVNLDTIEERIRNSSTRYISSHFRTRTSDGTYAWQLYSYLFAGDPADRRVMACTRRLNTDAVALLHGQPGSRNGDTVSEDGVTPELLWKNYIMSSDTAYFWKDKNRRFLGVNRKFLQYYGLESEDVLIGKNDEDMGWHINPEPFKNDEERILRNGEQTYLIPGSCICKGEIKEILASKMPIYKDGKIVGLMGYFLDMTDQKIRNMSVEQLSLNDPQTGTLNFLGLVESVLRYQESYVFEHLDFALIILDIERFHTFNQNYGMEWGNLLLQNVALKLRSAVGVTGVAGRLNSDHFIVVKQFDSRDQIEKFLTLVNELMAGILEIDGIPCTIYLRSGYSAYSETLDLQKMFLLAEERADARTRKQTLKKTDPDGDPSEENA